MRYIITMYMYIVCMYVCILCSFSDSVRHSVLFLQLAKCGFGERPPCSNTCTSQVHTVYVDVQSVIKGQWFVEHRCCTRIISKDRNVLKTRQCTCMYEIHVAFYRWSNYTHVQCSVYGG